MSRRTTSLLPLRVDGTSQRGRALPALDPDGVQLDERGNADLLSFVQKFAEQLLYFSGEGEEVTEAGNWKAFASAVSATDIAAYLEDPSRFSGESARWLSRPHFALLLTFLELLRHPREQLNQFARRHLEFYYRDVLQLVPLPAEPDRVALLFRLASRIPEYLLPAGSKLTAGQDENGVEQLYQTEEDLLINRAQVSSLRSVYVDRRTTGISDVRRDASYTAAGALDATLRIALGSPNAGDPVKTWNGMTINTAFLVGLRSTLDFARKSLYLEQDELRVLMQRVRRRQAANGEWAEINRLMGVVNPTNPRDFNGNLEYRVGKLDFKNDGLPQVDDIDDVYEHRTETDVRAYIDTRLKLIGYDNFTAMMPIKLRIDAEWAEINRLLERAGRRQRNLLTWNLSPTDPSNFDQNLQKALQGRWPPAWPSGTTSIDSYDQRLRSLETHLSLSVERLERLVTFAESLGTAADARVFDWDEVDEALADAHSEQVYAGRRALLAAFRGGKNDLNGFDLEVTAVLSEGKTDPLRSWASARPDLAKVLNAGQLSMLDTFRDQQTRAGATQLFDWPDVDRVLEFAQRCILATPDPVALKVEWRNLYAYPDATARLDASNSPRWITFGGIPEADATVVPEPNLGFAIRSPLLALSQGNRNLTLTLGFSPTGFNRDTILKGLGIDPALLNAERLLTGLSTALVVGITTAKGWIQLPILSAKLNTGKVGDDYWSVRGTARTVDENRGALQLELGADASRDAFTALPGETCPVLRLMLRPSWDSKGRQWLTQLGAFESLQLAAVHLAVKVEGLKNLSLQQEDRPLDSRKPFEPFGSRPAVGSRLYLSHPELVQHRLETLRFDISWMGLPTYLTSYYKNYSGITGSNSFTANIALVDHNISFGLADLALFEDTDISAKDATVRTYGSPTLSKRSLKVDNVVSQVTKSGFVYARSTLTPGADLRADGRFFQWELTPTDFGHSVYAALAAQKGREQAVALSKQQIADATAADNYRVDAPYTPTIRSISVAYTTSLELNPLVATAGHELLHLHPFGETAVSSEDASFFGTYDQAGELYIGLRELVAPCQLSLLLQLAEGTSDPDLEPASVSWSALDGDTWQELVVLSDSTRGLINSGIVRLEIPDIKPGNLLPSGEFYLRVAVPKNPSSVCMSVAIRAQAVFARFQDQGNSPSHYLKPLSEGSISRLVEPDARISLIEQPFTSVGGKSAETPAQFYVRVSERLRHKQRALTGWDYERLVLQEFPQIYKAKCLPSKGDGKVELIVIPDIHNALPSDALSPKAPANLLADITTFLQSHAPASATVSVRNARYVPVQVRLGVRFLAGQEEGFAKKRLSEDLLRFLSPWAYEDGQELMMGGKIYATSIVDFVDRRSYVDYVAQIKLFRGTGDDNFLLLPPTTDYSVTTENPDEILVAATEHVIDVIPERGYEQSSFSGINYMKLELDFVVGA